MYTNIPCQDLGHLLVGSMKMQPNISATSGHWVISSICVGGH